MVSLRQLFNEKAGGFPAFYFISAICILWSDAIKEVMRDASDGFCQSTPTFPSDNPRIKIDYIFVSPDITVEHAEIPEIIASDHRIHIAEIK